MILFEKMHNVREEVKNINKYKKEMGAAMAQGLKLSDLKIVKNGYDTAQVQMMLREILTQSMQEKEAAVEKAREEEREKMRQSGEPQGSSQESIQKFDDWIQSLTSVWNQQNAYSKQQDAKLQQYYMREKELQESEEKARKEAESLKAEAQRTALEITDKAQQNANQVISNAHASAQRIRQDSEEARRNMESEAAQRVELMMEKARQDADRILKDAYAQRDQMLSDAQKEREAIVDMSTHDIRRVREDYQKTMEQIVKLLEDLAERSQVASQKAAQP